MTSLTPGLVTSATEVMWAGLAVGTMSTRVFVANSTGLATRPWAKSCCACLGLAEAKTSAGAPCSMSVSKAPEPPKVYLAAGSICGKALVSEAAAYTVGPSAAAPECVPGDDVELLLPHPAARTPATTAATTAPRRRPAAPLPVMSAPSPRLPRSWQNTGIMAMSPSSGRLRDRRREVGLTQAQLAQRAGVSRQLIAAVEAGRNVPA